MARPGYGFEGVQVVASLYGCGATALMTHAPALLERCRAAIERAGFQRVTDCSTGFVEGGGVSVAVVLAESHLAVHTWPEFEAVTLDVYACSYHRDNTGAANGLVDRLAGALGASTVLRQEVPRDRGAVSDWIGEAYGVFVETSSTLLDRRSEYQRVELHHTPQFGKMLRLDGRNQCAEREAYVYHEALVHPAATAHPDPRAALVVGGGDGGVAAELLRHPTVERVEVVELDPAVVEVAKEHLHAIHEGAFDDPRVELFTVDGARHLVDAPGPWDLILLDLTDAEGPAEALYGPDFLSTCRSKLRAGGYLVAHVDAPFGYADRMRRHLASLRSQFPVVRVQLIHVPVYGELAIAVCSVDADPLEVPPEEIDDRLHHRKVTELRCYDGATHHARFVLPPWVRRMIEEPFDAGPSTRDDGAPHPD